MPAPCVTGFCSLRQYFEYPMDELESWTTVQLVTNS